MFANAKQHFHHFHVYLSIGSILYLPVFYLKAVFIYHNDKSFPLAMNNEYIVTTYYHQYNLFL